MRRHLEFAVFVVWPACAVAHGVEAVVTAGRAANGVVGTTVLAAELVLAVGLFPALAATGGALLLGGALWAMAHRRAALVEPPIGDGVANLAAALVLVPITVALLYGTSLWSMRSFHNHELASLQLALVQLGIVCVASVAFVALKQFALAAHRLVAHRALAGALVLVPGTLAVVAVGATLVAKNVTGLRQLDTRLWWIAAAASATLVSSLVAARFVQRWRRVASWGLVAHVLVSGVALFAFSDGRVMSVAARHGVMSRTAVRALRAMTDVDRDGYSAWFGGGDCAPRDPKVHPGALEVPGDGLDNNCIGGDANALLAVKKPRWEKLPSSVPRGLDVVLVTVETLRADRVSFLGHPRPTTPVLDDLAKTSFVFERAYSASTITRLALPALLSSFGPSEIDWRPQARHKQMQAIGSSTPWLPQELQRIGYTTVAVHTAFRAFTQEESAGFDRGFTHYDASTRLSYVGGTMTGFPGAEQVDKAKSYLDKVGDAPVFLWIHFVEPHYRYEAPDGAPDFGTEELDRYDAEIWGVDRQIGRLIDHLKERGSHDRTIFFVVGDHGEEFLEHGERFHGSNLFEPQLRTAALLRVPGLPGARVKDPVVLQDFAPTLLNLLRQSKPFKKMRGRNLLPALLGGELAEKHFIVELFRVDNHREYRAAVIQWPHKLVYVEDGQTFALYDVSADPFERTQLDPAATEIGSSLQAVLHEYLDAVAKRTVIR